MELFAKPGAGGIIEKSESGIDYVLVQDRCKEDAKSEFGLLEIPAGKIREFENIYDCLRREVWEETGLTITKIQGEEDAKIFEANGYKVINYQPFACSQNIEGSYPIMVQTFICKVEGQMLKSSNESNNIRWMPVQEVKERIENHPDSIYPMHVDTLRKYLKEKHMEL